MKRTFWKEEELKTLKDLYCIKGMSSLEISKILNRTKDSIKIKVTRLKLNHTKEQTKLIKSNMIKGSNNPMYGKISPIRGLNKNNCESIKLASEKLSKIKKEQYRKGIIHGLKGSNNPMYGKTTWRKNQNKFNNEKVRLAGLKCSETQKKKWQELSEEEKNIKRKQWGLQGLKCPKKETKIEKIIKNTLDSLHIDYKTQQPIDRWSVDFLLTDGKIIECFGDYWHSNPQIYVPSDALTQAQINNIKRDKEKINYFENENKEYLILWETEILNGTALEKLKSFISKGV